MPMSRQAVKCKRQLRAAVLRNRTERLVGLGRLDKRMARGVAAVFRAGLKPCYAYGSKCLGMSDGRLRALGRAAARSPRGKVGGVSLAALLATEGRRGYPIYEVSVAPVVEWAMAAWGGSLATEALARAWRR